MRMLNEEQKKGTRGKVFLFRVLEAWPQNHQKICSISCVRRFFETSKKSGHETDDAQGGIELGFRELVHIP